MDADDPKEMTEYIATFWTHLAAMSTLKALAAAGIKATARPVPRALSSGCGTCVCYQAENPCLALMHRDYEKVVIPGGDAYQVVAENHDLY